MGKRESCGAEGRPGKRERDPQGKENPGVLWATDPPLHNIPEDRRHTKKAQAACGQRRATRAGARQRADRRQRRKRAGGSVEEGERGRRIATAERFSLLADLAQVNVARVVGVGRVELRRNLLQLRLLRTRRRPSGGRGRAAESKRRNGEPEKKKAALRPFECCERIRTRAMRFPLGYILR